jgi:hypothetical protein
MLFVVRMCVQRRWRRAATALLWEPPSVQIDLHGKTGFESGRIPLPPRTHPLDKGNGQINRNNKI